MFKKIFVSFLVAFLMLSLVSCNQKTYDIKDYMLELDYKGTDGKFKVLQLSDIHIAAADNRQYQYDFLTKIIKAAEADLIVVTGDLFTFGTRNSAKELFEFFDTFETPWTVTFGNHDEQCYFSIDWLTGYLNKLNDSDNSYCIFKDIQDDKVYGNANFAINVMQDGTLKEQVIVMDSNRYNFSEYTYYDYIKEDQINWYKDVVNYAKTLNPNATSSLYFHIPLPEFNNAFDEGELILGDKRENICCPKVNSNFWSVINELGHTKNICCGHDHSNDFVCKWNDVNFCYGVTSTDRVYYTKDLLGGLLRIVDFNNNLSIFEQVLVSYDDGGLTK